MKTDSTEVRRAWAELKTAWRHWRMTVHLARALRAARGDPSLVGLRLSIIILIQEITRRSRA